MIIYKVLGARKVLKKAGSPFLLPSVTESLYKLLIPSSL